MTYDHQLLLWINHRLAHPLLDGLMVAVSVLASPLPVGLLLCLLSGFERRPWRRLGRLLLVGIVLSTLIAVGVQLLLGRARPSGVRLVLPMPGFASFPSGHVAGVFAAAVALALVDRRATLPALAMAALVSFSRVYLGHHYPGDVVGGAILGAAVGAMVYGMGWVEDDRPRWAWLLWGWLALLLLAILAATLGLLHLGALTLPGADKVLHFFLYGGLAFLAVGWWGRRWWVPVLLILAGLAVIEEGLQLLVPGRSFDLLDLALSLGGVVLGAVLAGRWTSRG